MRIAIEQQIVHRPGRGPGQSVRMVRLTPENYDDQTVVHWRIDVDCDARMRRGQDGFGNAVTMLYVDAAIDTITITASGEVLTSDAHGLVRGATETLPPALFLRATALTPAEPAIVDWAAGIAASAAAGPLAVLHGINAALHRAEDSAVALLPDPAHVFCVAARSLGIPARYVSGYVARDETWRGQPHGWAEAHVEGLGWIGFDPATGLSPQDGHVRVAIALDAAGTASIAGPAPMCEKTEAGEGQ
ncbi:transglutaminase family protein [Sphingomonadaceae bacterium jetA1]|jgi:transglutaminase-like putative cysteine protease|uniref:transglutaminase family protein n=1 Tax=Facivitalis istanbulensis TaxID=3075838 RepID=UPI00348F25C0